MNKVEQAPITVLMPVYNAQEFIADAVESVLNQTFDHFELMLINDGSTDNSVNIIKTYNDPRINLIHNTQNLGLIKTLNKGIQLIESKYIVRADADDVCLKNRLELQYGFMESNPEIDICGTWFDNFQDEVKSKGGRYEKNDFAIKLKQLYQIHLCHGTAIIKTELFKKNNLVFDSNYAHAEDYDLFDRLSEFCTMSNITEVLYLVRLHETQVSSKHSETQKENTDKIRLRAIKRVFRGATQEHADLYTQLMHQNYNSANGEVLRLLEDLDSGNRNSGRFSREQFRLHLSKVFYHYCSANSSELPNGFWSTLNQASFFSFSDLRFVDKCKVILRTIF